METLVLLLLLLSGGSSLVLGLGAQKYRVRGDASRLFLVFTLLCFFYAMGSAMERLSGTPQAIWYWGGFQYLFTPLLAPVLLLLTIDIAGWQGRLSRLGKVLIFIIPVLSLVLRQTNAWHHLFYLADAGGPVSLEYRPGPAHQIYAIWNNISVVAVLVLGGLRLSLSPAVYRPRIRYFMVGILLPWMAYVLYLLRLTPNRMDLTPVSLCLATPFWFLSLYRHRLLDLRPIAREMVFSSIPQGILVLNPEGYLEDFNEGAIRLFPDLTPDCLGLPVAELVPEILPEPLLHMAGGSSALAGEGRDVMHLGRFLKVQVTSLHRGRSFLGTLLLIGDNTQTVHLLEELQKTAMTDPLTGVFNRRQLFQILQREVERFDRYQAPLSLILMDLDHFKRINDRHGHPCGDAALRHVVGILRQESRQTDVLGRYGGEEFVVVLPHTPLEQAVRVAERMRSALAGTPLIWEEGQVWLTASMGVGALQGKAPRALEAWLREVDQALYQAKALGRNRVVEVASGRA